MDETYLDEELKKIGLYDFEKEMKELAFKVFSHLSSDSPLTKKKKECCEKCCLIVHTAQWETIGENK